MQNHASTYDLVIAGAGVAGAALAAFLGRHGIKIALVEKDWREQERIVGELLQPGGVQQLAALGLENTLEGFDAQEVCGYSIFNHGKNITVAYPKSANKYAFTGRGFRNGKFLQRLREAARAQASVTCFEAEAKALVKTDGRITGLKIQQKAMEETLTLSAQLTVVCDGIFSAFRTEIADVQKEVSGYFLGLVLEDCPLPFPHHGHVFTGSTSPFLAYPITGSEVRMLIDFPGSEAPRRGEALQQHLLQNILPQLPQTMHQSFMQAVAKQQFKSMPNHYMPAKPKPSEGAVLIGDALNMRHPLTGGGMTVALTDVYLLGTKLLDYFNHKVKSEFLITRAVNEFYATRHEKDATVNILANALYKVFTHPQLSTACFNYLRQGGNKSAQPVELLSAISRNRNLLLRHFFAVAVDGATHNAFTDFSFKSIKDSYHMVGDAVKIVSPLLSNEHPGKAEQLALWLGKKVFSA